jgi:hypothetical protein
MEAGNDGGAGRWSIEYQYIWGGGEVIGDFVKSSSA